jgi:hypothetical protein
MNLYNAPRTREQPPRYIGRFQVFGRRHTQVSERFIGGTSC